MRKYNPDLAPDPEQWLALDEDLRINLIERYHRKARIRLPNVDAHACFHTIIENQIAMRHPPVVRAMERLASQGLSRHDCIHAIGAALAGHVNSAMSANSDITPETLSAKYDAAVERLTAARWLAQADDDE